MSYAERLRELNAIQEGKTIWDSIDRPIRPLIYELNKAGLKTIFSCCGFSYENEEEPKTHARYPFVVYTLTPHPIAIRNFFRLATYASNTGWTLNPYHGLEWHLSFRGGNSELFYRVGDEPGIHDYEQGLIAIRRMTGICELNLDEVDEKFTIEDGNSHKMYDALGGEWQVKPKPSIESTSIPKEPNNVGD
jgi:hypothetical protein